eukprot:6079694-Amphidinium_carterae.1
MPFLAWQEVKCVQGNADSPKLSTHMAKCQSHRSRCACVCWRGMCLAYLCACPSLESRRRRKARECDTTDWPLLRKQSCGISMGVFKMCVNGNTCNCAGVARSSLRVEHVPGGREAQLKYDGCAFRCSVERCGMPNITEGHSA